MLSCIQPLKCDLIFGNQIFFYAVDSDGIVDHDSLPADIVTSFTLLCVLVYGGLAANSLFNTQPL